MGTQPSSHQRKSDGDQDEIPIRGFMHRILEWYHHLDVGVHLKTKVFQQEGNYTVADSIHDDTYTIESTNLPMIWIITAPGTPLMLMLHRLADIYGFYHMNIGALLQREISLETNRDDEVHHLMHRGVAIPRAFIFEMIRKQMAQVCRQKEHKGFILTEYPATISQADDFFKHIYKPDFILHIKLSDKLTKENLYIYLKFQVRASKVLRKLHPNMQGVAIEQNQKFKRNIDKIKSKYSSIFKVIDGSMSPEEVCRDIMKWIERAEVMHNLMPPLFVELPLGEDYGRGSLSV
ncbi:Adenylate kinase isoenzyme 5 [Orchesella cincta]|uniref:Adenylate kinase isoenzyme 5 n=1 Tax=Orchesella cincta TaxID=48709 RepID=A0A1D2MY82_ORCCI|nr:Adenylate kinase isoenzyme 5 [Orchesella cincta]